MAESQTKTKRTRRARMTTVRPSLPASISPRSPDLYAERILPERVLQSAALKRSVGVYARANGITMPKAWRDLVNSGLIMAGLAASEQGEVKYGTGSGTGAAISTVAN